MTKEYTLEEIKNRLSNIGEAIGNIALEYITKLEKENQDLRDNYDQFKAIAEPERERLQNENAELEKENESLKGDLELWESGGCRATNLFECGVVKELKEQLTKKADTNHSLVEQMADLESENAELNDQLTKAKEIIKKIYTVFYTPCVTQSDLDYRDKLFAEIRQFLKADVGTKNYEEQDKILKTRLL